MRTILIFLLFTSQMGFAQDTLKTYDIRLKVSKALTQHNDRYLLGKTPKGFVYIFSVTLSFNEAGKIDTIYFSKKIDENVSKVMKLNSSLIKRIKDQNSIYKIYSSKLVFIPVFYHSTDDDMIYYRSGFLESFENLLPDINISNKQWIILNPLIEQFSPPRR